MNRSLANVIFGGYAVKPPKAGEDVSAEVLEHQEIDVASTADALIHAKKVIIVPG